VSRNFYGAVLAEALVSDVDAERGRRAAMAHMAAFARQERVRTGEAAVVVVGRGRDGGDDR
jgi:hypothetical protein